MKPVSISVIKEKNGVELCEYRYANGKTNLVVRSGGIVLEAFKGNATKKAEAAFEMYA